MSRYRDPQLQVGENDFVYFETKHLQIKTDYKRLKAYSADPSYQFIVFLFSSYNTALQSLKAVSAYFSSKQMLPFVFAR